MQYNLKYALQQMNQVKVIIRTEDFLVRLGLLWNCDCARDFRTMKDTRVPDYTDTLIIMYDTKN